MLARRGVGAVTVLDLSERLGVSRSSFYWHFRNRDGLIDALLERWDDLNTRSIVQQAEAPAATIIEAVLNIFRCWVDAALFSPRLDLAVREWARRSEPVRQRLDRSDNARMTAIEAMFRRHGYPPDDALVRARVLYTMQIGYYALEIKEPIEVRLALAPHYLRYSPAYARARASSPLSGPTPCATAAPRILTSSHDLSLFRSDHPARGPWRP